jgi:hypothetical protein
MEISEFKKMDKDEKDDFSNFKDYLMKYGKNAIDRVLSEYDNLEEIFQELEKSKKNDD